MEPFFGQFQGFAYHSTQSPERNFRRLQENQGWPGTQYPTFRLQFFNALVEETNSPVHRFFITQHPDFLTYDSDASPRSEFERLRIFKNWTEDGLDEESKALFEIAFQEEFSGALDNYYSRYTDFLYDPRRPPMVEFNRLMKHKKWKPRHKKYKEARKRFFDAFIEDFNTYFGTDDNDITTWQHLCEVLGVDPIPETVTQCRKILRPLNVNIYDLLHHKRTGAPFDIFPSLRQLRSYTVNKDLYFPRAQAKQGPLRFLLREIFVKPTKKKD